jgi:hypothetical protein
MTDKQKQWIAYAIVVVAILVAGFFGVTYPIPAPPAATVGSQSFIYPPGAIYFAEGGKSQVFQDGSSATYQSGSTLTTASGSTLAMAGWMNATGVITATGGIVGNVTSTGVNTFGSVSATYITGTTSISGNLAGNVTSTGSNTFGTASSTYLTSTNAISMQGATFTGPVKYGTAASYESAAAITHGFATTPTMCIIFPSRDVTETLTLAATTFSSDRASQATPVYWVCGK